MTSAPRTLTWQERRARQKADAAGRKKYYESHYRKVYLASRVVAEPPSKFNIGGSGYRERHE